MKVQIEESWRRQLQEEFDKPYFEHLVGFVKEEYARYTVFPPGVVNLRLSAKWILSAEKNSLCS